MGRTSDRQPRAAAARIRSRPDHAEDPRARPVDRRQARGSAAPAVPVLEAVGGPAVPRTSPDAPREAPEQIFLRRAVPRELLSREAVRRRRRAEPELLLQEEGGIAEDLVDHRGDKDVAGVVGRGERQAAARQARVLRARDRVDVERGRPAGRLLADPQAGPEQRHRRTAVRGGRAGAGRGFLTYAEARIGREVQAGGEEPPRDVPCG